MPEKEGLETIRDLRRAGPVRIIAMSGDGMAAEHFLRVARHLGAARALHKPFEIEELFAAMRAVLEEAGSGSQGAEGAGGGS